ncbi:hypothetical protein C8F04DRAFT_1392038, partial [Mycena alexandri]
VAPNFPTRGFAEPHVRARAHFTLIRRAGCQVRPFSQSCGLGNTYPHCAEPDDALPDPSLSNGPKASAISRRGLIDIGCLVLLWLILLGPLYSRLY